MALEMCFGWLTNTTEYFCAASGCLFSSLFRFYPPRKRQKTSTLREIQIYFWLSGREKFTQIAKNNIYFWLYKEKFIPL
jgi:hypothetical protein